MPPRAIRRSRLPWIVIASTLAVTVAVAASPPAKSSPPAKTATPPATEATAKDPGKVTKSDADWREILAPEAYRVLRQKGTERAFSGRLWDEHRAGTYSCAGCALALFSSTTKFESGTGWPSFWAPIAANHVRGVPDLSYGGMNTEIVCARCGGHLGHVFEDGPKPTGLRYCMNSAAMTFRPKDAR
jgi:peptide-methionine (R)-S-oxide reductase